MKPIQTYVRVFVLAIKHHAPPPPGHSKEACVTFTTALRADFYIIWMRALSNTNVFVKQRSQDATDTELRKRRALFVIYVNGPGSNLKQNQDFGRRKIRILK